MRIPQQGRYTVRDHLWRKRAPQAVHSISNLRKSVRFSFLKRNKPSFLLARKGTQSTVSDKIFGTAAPPETGVHPGLTRVTPGLSSSKKTLWATITNQRDLWWRHLFFLLWQCLWRYVLLHFRFEQKFICRRCHPSRFGNLRLTWITSR